MTKRLEATIEVLTNQRDLAREKAAQATKERDKAVKDLALQRAVWGKDPRALDLPNHECGLYMEHNPHRDEYRSLSEYFADAADTGAHSWQSDEAKARAIETDELWTLQWYPHTPIGSHTIAAPTLGELLAFAAEVS